MDVFALHCMQQAAVAAGLVAGVGSGGWHGAHHPELSPLLPPGDLTLTLPCPHRLPSVKRGDADDDASDEEAAMNDAVAAPEMFQVAPGEHYGDLSDGAGKSATGKVRGQGAAARTHGLLACLLAMCPHACTITHRITHALPWHLALGSGTWRRCLSAPWRPAPLPPPATRYVL